MGADGGIYYFSNSEKNLFHSQLIEALFDWLCSDICLIEFDGHIFVKSDLIYKYNPDNDETEDDANVLFTKNQLGFINQIHTHVENFCNRYQRIPDEYDCMTWSEFEQLQKIDPNIYFRDDFDDLTQMTVDVNNAWDIANGLWFYWDTSSYHGVHPFDKQNDINMLYDECSNKVDAFTEFFTNLEMFTEFIDSLPDPDYVQIWT